MHDSTSPDVVTRYENDTWSRCADSYADTFHMLTSQALPLLMQVAAIRGGERVLDLGCGPGDGSATLAGTGARITGVDFSRQMIDVARRRHPQIAFHDANAEALPPHKMSMEATGAMPRRSGAHKGSGKRRSSAGDPGQGRTPKS